MPNLAAALKAEICRVARKELRTATEQLKKVVATLRSEIAGLKRRVQELEKRAKAQSRAAGRATKQLAASSTEGTADVDGLRFRATGMASNRKRLGLRPPGRCDRCRSALQE